MATCTGERAITAPISAADAAAISPARRRRGSATAHASGDLPASDDECSGRTAGRGVSVDARERVDEQVRE